MSSVTAIIPSWNRRDLVEKILYQLRVQTAPIERAIVVDNGSSDGTAQVAEGLGATVISMGCNAGFSRAVNRGIEANKSDWLAILNNDVDLTPNWLEGLLEAATSRNAWFATGKLLRSDRHQEMDGAFDAVCRGACAWRGGQGRPDGPLWSQTESIFFAPFTAAIFRRELFERVGNLDERFDSYLEDVDFGLRCALLGLEGAYVPAAVAYHQGSATWGAWNAEAVRLIARNQMFLVAKHYSRAELLRYGWPILVAQLLWGGIALRHGAGWAYIKGKWEGATRFRGIWKSSPLETRNGENLQLVLERSEETIRDLQRTTGFDLYWRLYFALT